MPKLRTNLISVTKLVDDNKEVRFRKLLAFLAHRMGDLYYLIEDNQSACSVVESKDSKSDTKIWHAKLGHLNQKDMNAMLTNKNVFGMKFNKPVDLTKCQICLQGKITSTPFAKRKATSSELLELVYSDVCGPMRESSMSGARYFVTFIDDYSQWCILYFLRHNGEVVDKFLEFKHFVENQTGKKIKTF